MSTVCSMMANILPHLFFSRYETGLLKRHSENGHKAGRASSPWVRESTNTCPAHPRRKAEFFPRMMRSASIAEAATTAEWRAASGSRKRVLPHTSSSKAFRENALLFVHSHAAPRSIGISGSVAPRTASAAFRGVERFVVRITAYVRVAWEYVRTGKSYHVWKRREEAV